MGGSIAVHALPWLVTMGSGLLLVVADTMARAPSLLPMVLDSIEILLSSRPELVSPPLHFKE